jgi:MFS family permease
VGGGGLASTACLLRVLATLQIQSVTSTQLLISLSGGSVAVMAQHTAGVNATVNLLSAFLSPVVCALSDQFGRLPFVVAGQLGRLLWLLAQTRLTSLRQRAMCVIGFLGVMRAGVGVVQTSAFGDLFAYQPEVSAQIQAANGMWSQLGSATGLFLGAGLRALLRPDGLNTVFLVSAALVGAQALVITQLMPETLDQRDRKQLVGGGTTGAGGVCTLLRQANPFSALATLARNGPGLVRLPLRRSVRSS